MASSLFTRLQGVGVEPQTDDRDIVQRNKTQADAVAQWLALTVASQQEGWFDYGPGTFSVEFA